MDKLKKRLDDLDTIENNIKLLNDLLSQYSTSSSEDERQLVKVSKKDLILLSSCFSLAHTQFTFSLTPSIHPLSTLFPSISPFLVFAGAV